MNRSDIRRLVELIGLPGLLLGAVALPVPLMADRLPDPLASHWGVDGRPDGSADAVVLALAVTWASTVRVTVSEQGLRIAFGPFGIPAKHMPLERIAGAEATEIEPLRWGGWGYRWAGRGRSAVVVRRGPGLVLDLRDGGRFAVTVDEPAPAAGLINDLRRRHGPG